MVEQIEANGARGDGEDASPMDRMGDALQPSRSGLPDWFVPPANFKAPPGRRVVVMRFRPGWTHAPEKGERQIVCWPLTEQEEHLASQRAHGNDRKMVSELAKQCVRYVDGMRVDWTMTPGAGVDVNQVWRELGSACTKLIIHYYVKAHTLSAEDQIDFFANCIVSTISVPDSP